MGLLHANLADREFSSAVVRYSNADSTSCLRLSRFASIRRRTKPYSSATIFPVDHALLRCSNFLKRRQLYKLAFSLRSFSAVFCLSSFRGGNNASALLPEMSIPCTCCLLYSKTRMAGELQILRPICKARIFLEKCVAHSTEIV